VGKDKCKDKRQTRHSKKTKDKARDTTFFLKSARHPVCDVARSLARTHDTNETKRLPGAESTLKASPNLRP